MSFLSFVAENGTLIGAVLIGAAIPIGLAIDKKLKNKKESYCKFEEQSGKLYLYKRGAKIRSYIKIREHMNYSFGRTNEQLNFGAATVGGVTTGGFYKTGNDLYVSEEKKSGRYELAFVVGADQTSKVMIKNEYRSITEIIPVGDLALDAKASRISRFMDKKTNHIRVVDMGRTKVSSDELFKMAQDVSNVSGSKEYTQAGVSGVGSMDTQAKLNMAYPTKEKCEEILNWLAGE